MAEDADVLTALAGMPNKCRSNTHTTREEHRLKAVSPHKKSDTIIRTCSRFYPRMLSLDNNIGVRASGLLLLLLFNKGGDLVHYIRHHIDYTIHRGSGRGRNAQQAHALSLND